MYIFDDNELKDGEYWYLTYTDKEALSIWYDDCGFQFSRDSFHERTLFRYEAQAKSALSNLPKRFQPERVQIRKCHLNLTVKEE